KLLVHLCCINSTSTSLQMLSKCCCLLSILLLFVFTNECKCKTLDTLHASIQNDVPCKLVVVAAGDGEIWSQYLNDSKLPTNEELKKLYNDMKNNFSDIEKNGINLGGITYTFVGGNDRLVTAKNGMSYLVAAPTKQQIIVAVSENGNEMQLNKVVKIAADYTIANG
ncbi:profilin-like protein, partial [Leptotrombidium deliense]